jgi:uncharacterized membrane protein
MEETSRLAPPSERSRLGLAAFMVVAGIMHFVVPRFYERIVPPWAGSPQRVVFWSGWAEILSGVLVGVPRSKRLGAWCSLVVLVAVYPANVHMALEAGRPRDAISAAAWLRLPLQLPMWRWAFRHTRPAA